MKARLYLQSAHPEVKSWRDSANMDSMFMALFGCRGSFLVSLHFLSGTKTRAQLQAEFNGLQTTIYNHSQGRCLA